MCDRAHLELQVLPSKLQLFQLTTFDLTLGRGRGEVGQLRGHGPEAILVRLDLLLLLGRRSHVSC